MHDGNGAANERISLMHNNKKKAKERKKKGRRATFVNLSKECIPLLF